VFAGTPPRRSSLIHAIENSVQDRRRSALGNLDVEGEELYKLHKNKGVDRSDSLP